MQTLLYFVREWSLSHHLSINVSKCFALYVSGTRTTYLGNLALYIDGKPISAVDNLKILGVFFTTDLKWHLHHSSIRCKISHMIGVVHRFDKSLDLASRTKIVTAFILPHLRFCLPVWVMPALVLPLLWTMSCLDSYVLSPTTRLQYLILHFFNFWHFSF